MMGPAIAHRPRQAALRHPGHRRRLRQQDHLAPAARRDAACSRASSTGAIQWTEWRTEFHLTMSHGNERYFRDTEVAGQERRHAARLPDEGARRRRRLHPLRAARRRDLGAGDAGHVPLAKHPPRLHAGGDEQGAVLAEPRLLAHAAPLVHRAGDRHRRRRARPRSGRGPQAQLHPRRGDAVHDAERLRLRLGRLRGDARPGARADRLRARSRRAAPRRRPRGKLLGVGIGSTLDSRHEQLRPVAPDQPGAAVLGQQRGRDGEARHLRRDRGHARARRRRGRGTRRSTSQVVADILGCRPRLGQRPRRPRLLLELARRLLGHLREPVRGHRPLGRQGRGRRARATTSSTLAARHARRRRARGDRARRRLREARRQPGGRAALLRRRRDRQREQRRSSRRRAARSRSTSATSTCRRSSCPTSSGSTATSR